MQNSKLISLLKALSESELKRFMQYMQSPFFKKSANAITLFEWINRQGNHPAYDSPKLNSDFIAQYLFPRQKNKTLKDKSLSVTTSELVKLLRHFFALLEIEQEQVQLQFMTVQNLQKKRLDKEVWQILKKLQQQQKKEQRKAFNIITINFYWRNHFITFVHPSNNCSEKNKN